MTLKIYNLLGQEVATLINHEQMSEGSQEAELISASYNLATGVYFYRLTAEEISDEDHTAGHVYNSTRKMLFVK